MGIFAGKQIVFGPLAGMLVGYLGGKLVVLCYRTGWMRQTAEGIIVLALAFGAFALAELVHCNGFIAAFAGGLTFGNTLKYKCAFLYEFSEAIGFILIMAAFMAFGGAMIPEAVEFMSALHVVFVLLALTLMRMVPVHISLLGTHVKPVTSAFLGWFGPRGLASVLFVLLILECGQISPQSDIFAAVVATVILSIALHGITAAPAALWYGARTRRMGPCEETKPVSEEPFSEPSTATEGADSQET